MDKLWYDVENGGSAGGNSMIETTCEELVSLMQNDGLIPQKSYRVTDFITELKSDDSLMFMAGHQYDLILTASTTNSFVELVRATCHEGDTYFAKSDLAKWELKIKFLSEYASSEEIPYIYQGITTPFFVTYMKDEWDNECTWDFKNCIVNGKYTFNHNDSDASLKADCCRNIFIMSEENAIYGLWGGFLSSDEGIIQDNVLRGFLGCAVSDSAICNNTMLLSRGNSLYLTTSIIQIGGAFSNNTVVNSALQGTIVNFANNFITNSSLLFSNIFGNGFNISASVVGCSINNSTFIGFPLVTMTNCVFEGATLYGLYDKEEYVFDNFYIPAGGVFYDDTGENIHVRNSKLFMLTNYNNRLDVPDFFIAESDKAFYDYLQTEKTEE